LHACRFGFRHARSLKHHGSGSLDTSRLVASPESGFSGPGSHSQVGERNQSNRPYICRQVVEYRPNMYVYMQADIFVYKQSITISYRIKACEEPSCFTTNHIKSTSAGLESGSLLWTYLKKKSGPLQNGGHVLSRRLHAHRLGPDAESFKSPMSSPLP
jgi:hypothetical protein